MWRIRFVAVLLIAGVGGNLLAGSDSVERDTLHYLMNPVVVTADRMEGLLRNVDASVSIVPSAVPRFVGAYTVPEALGQAVPGLFVSQRGVMGFGVGPGSAGTITLRGIGGSPNTQVLMMIDGRPDLMGMMGHPLPDAYDLDAAERIEVVRGPASVLYGSNAMGGVINIIPRRLHRPGKETILRARTGTWNTRFLAANHGRHFGSWDYYVTASNKHTDGHRPESSFDGTNYTFRAGFHPREGVELSISGYGASFKAYDPGPQSSPYTDHWVDVFRAGVDVQLKAHTKAGRLQAKLYQLYGRHDIYDGWHSTDRTYGATAHLATELFAGNQAVFGWDVIRYGGHGENRKRGKDFGTHYITQWAPYMLVRQAVSGKLVLSAGFRLEHHELFGYEPVPKFGVVIQPVENLSIRFHSGKGFRSPTIRELYLFPAPTPTLKPERLWNNELGILWQHGQKFRLDLTAFRSRGDNLIRVEGIFPALKLTNSGSFVHRGMEWDAVWIPAGNVNLRFFGALLDPDEQTRFAPKRRFGLSAVFSSGNVQGMVQVNRVEELYGSDRHRNRLPDYTTVDLAVSFRLTRVLNAVLRLQNALDEKYQILPGYPMPGRHVSVELGAAF